MDAHHLGGLALAQPLPLDQEQSPAAQLLLRRPTDAAEVSCLHADAIAPALRDVRYIRGRLVRSYKELGNHKLPERPKGEYVSYVLDGQQRITSLYAIRKGIRITKDGEIIDYKDIFIDLD